MNKKIDLVFAIIGIILITVSFTSGNQNRDIFGISINIWIYRILISIITIRYFYKYFNVKKTE